MKQHSLPIALALTALVGTIPFQEACSDDSGGTNQQDASLADRSLQDAVAPDAPAPDAAQDIDGTPGCKPAVADPLVMGHAEGQDCLSCHDNMGGNLHWTLAGTAYEDIDGTSALAGGTVTLVDDTGKVLDLTTGIHGNFYTLEPVTFPVTVVVSKCPDLVQMVQPLETRRGCNDCHGPGNRIHLP